MVLVGGTFLVPVLTGCVGFESVWPKDCRKVGQIGVGGEEYALRVCRDTVGMVVVTLGS